MFKGQQEGGGGYFQPFFFPLQQSGQGAKQARPAWGAEKKHEIQTRKKTSIVDNDANDCFVFPVFSFRSCRVMSCGERLLPRSLSCSGDETEVTPPPLRRLQPVYNEVVGTRVVFFVFSSWGF